MTRALVLSVGAVAAAVVLAVGGWLRRGSCREQRRLNRLRPIVMKNKDGVEVHITPVGASIQRLIIPISGAKRDVVLGFNTPASYAVSRLCACARARKHCRASKCALSTDRRGLQLV
jgi:hypothetical protein